MTVSTLASQSIFSGNGLTNEFSFQFNNSVPYTSETPQATFNVIYTDANGIATTLSPSVYTLNLTAALPGQLWGIGGSLIYPISGPAIANGTSLTLQRIFPVTQETSIRNQGNNYPAVVEQALDIQDMISQQVSDRTGQFLGTWVTGMTYTIGDVVIDGANGANTGNYYMCALPNVSGTWATDLANGDWSLAINTQQFVAYQTAAAASATAAASSASSASTSATTATTQASSASASASSASTSATNAATSATQASNFAIAYSGTSTTSQMIGTGAYTFTTQANKLWVNGQYLQIASNANAANYMHGTVTSYSGSTLVMNITDVGGSGTHADWNISISGTQGTAGPAGSGNINAGTANQLGYYAGNGNTISGTNAIPNGTTATKQTALDNSTKVATTSYVDSAVAASVTSLSGDGTIFSNSDSTGAVTLSLEHTPTGTGGVVLATSPTLVTPALGTPASGNLSNCTNVPVSLITPLAIGSIINAINQSGVTVNANGTASASNLAVYSIFNGGSNVANLFATGDSIAGTWKALQTLPNTNIGLWQRIA